MVINFFKKMGYDRLNWQFIRETLVDVGLLENLVNIIMRCINSSNMQLLWNGAASNSFSPTRGIQ